MRLRNVYRSPRPRGRTSGGEHWFVGIHDARQTIETYRRDYNTYRPHSSLGGKTPEEFARCAAFLQAPPAPSEPQRGRINPVEGLSE